MAATLEFGGKHNRVHVENIRSNISTTYLCVTLKSKSIATFEQLVKTLAAAISLSERHCY